ncbi:hypothetical protein VTK56DRAFT_9385 [Thermocarpiscus australiensis]
MTKGKLSEPAELNKEGDPTSKSEAKKMMAQEEYQARKEHSKSGANTGQKQGMEYVPRKSTAEVPHNN